MELGKVVGTSRHPIHTTLGLQYPVARVMTHVHLVPIQDRDGLVTSRVK